MPDYVDTILCEVIRQEANNKTSFLGVFGTAIFVPKIPTQLPSLAFAQRWVPSSNEAEGTGFTFRFEVRGPGFEKALKLQEYAMKVGPGPRPQMSFAIQIQGFPLPQRGNYQLVTYIDGRESNVFDFLVEIPTEDQRKVLQLTGFG